MQRDQSLDIAKGIGILAVILSHISLGFYLDNIFYIFHVPLFFVINGYLFKDKGSFGEFCLKKLKAYMIPYVAFGLIIALAFYVGGGFSVSEFLSSVNSFIFQRRYTTLWFLTLLFLANIMFSLIVRGCKGDKIKVLVVSTLISCLGIAYDEMGGAPLIWNFDTACISLIFVAYGWYLRNFAKSLKETSTLKNIFICIVLALGLTILNYKLTGRPIQMFESSYGYAFLTIPAAMLGSLAVLLISQHLSWSPLVYLGQNSLAYFALHQSLSMEFYLRGMPLLGIQLPYVLDKICFFIFVMVITYLLQKGYDFCAKKLTYN